MAERERMGGSESNEELKKEFEELQKEYSQQEDVSTFKSGNETIDLDSDFRFSSLYSSV